MLQSLVQSWSAVVRLLTRLGVPRLGMFSTILVMLLGGAAEGATVGVLVPLLTMLTGQPLPADGALARHLPFLWDLSRRQQLLLFAGTILVLIVIKNLLGYSSAAAGGRLRTNALTELRRQLLERVLHASPTALERHTSGEIAGVFLGDTALANRALDYVLALIQRSAIWPPSSSSPTSSRSSRSGSAPCSAP
jgi:ABC-type multidrug transport system fused ATPase/permease subunit